MAEQRQGVDPSGNVVSETCQLNSRRKLEELIRRFTPEGEHNSLINGQFHDELEQKRKEDRLQSSQLSVITLRIEAILDKTIRDRTPQDLDVLHAELAKLDFFKKLQVGAVAERELCRVASLQYFMFPGQEIFRQGEEGVSFYVILSGILRVLQLDDKHNQREVAQLGPGLSFGELALLYGQRRTATVVVDTPSKLLVIKKADFEKYIRPIQQREIVAKVDLLREVSVFERPDGAIEALAAKMTMKHFSVGAVIAEEGTVCRGTGGGGSLHSR